LLLLAVVAVGHTALIMVAVVVAALVGLELVQVYELLAEPHIS
jgi:hypothetical protein